MYVKLVGYSKSCHGEESLQDLICYYARVSNPSNQHNSKNNEKLLNYLIQHHHWSPFEMVNICMEIETTRDIARQLLRHRSFSFQEFSQRYAEVKDDFCYKTARLQDQKNRQNSVDTDDTELCNLWEVKQKEVALLCQETYQWALSQNIAKEQARSVLPEGMTPTKLYMNGTLRSWIHYLQLRCGNGTQKEHMELAWMCVKEIEPLFPSIQSILVA